PLLARRAPGRSLMHWLFGAARRLRELGILGMNRRNAAYILDHNPRARYPLVDDKLRMRDLCVRIGVPTPEVFCEIRYHSELRRPTRASNGRANLHQGGIGAGVDLDTGRTNHAVQSDRFVERHPDTQVSVVGMQVPSWRDVLRLARRVAEAVGLGYLGVDIVV